MSPNPIMQDLLPRTKLADINKALALVNDTLALCDGGDNCGADTSVRRQTLEQLRQDFSNWKALAFPNSR